MSAGGRSMFVDKPRSAQNTGLGRYWDKVYIWCVGLIIMGRRYRLWGWFVSCEARGQQACTSNRCNACRLAGNPDLPPRESQSRVDVVMVENNTGGRPRIFPCIDH